MCGRLSDQIPRFQNKIWTMFPRQRDSKVINLPFIAARFAITDDPNIYNITERGKEVFQLQLACLQKKPAKNALYLDKRK